MWWLFWRPCCRISAWKAWSSSAYTLLTLGFMEFEKTFYPTQKHFSFQQIHYNSLTASKKLRISQIPVLRAEGRNTGPVKGFILRTHVTDRPENLASSPYNTSSPFFFMFNQPYMMRLVDYYACRHSCMWCISQFSSSIILSAFLSFPSNQAKPPFC